jgi:hypothetical protein
VRRIAELQQRESVVAILEGRDLATPAPRPTPAPSRAKPAPPPTAAEILAALAKDPSATGAIAAVINRGDLDVLRALLDGGLPPDAVVCHNGRVPLLSYTVLRGRAAMTALLIERGAPVNAWSLSRGDRDPLMTGFVMGERMGRPRAADCPKGDDAKQGVPVFTPLMYAALSRNAEAIDRLLAAGADVNARSVDGLTALMAASGKNLPESVRLLLVYGAQIDAAIENPERKGELNADRATALWLAAFNGAADAAQARLEAGADPAIEAQCRFPLAAPGESVCTPRRIAVLKGHERVVPAIDARQAEPGKQVP